VSSLRDRAVPRPRRETSRALPSGEPLETFAVNRRCTADGCTARLSRYNPSDTCAVHRGWVDTRVRAPYGG
jgi:hypothetical protein